VYADSDVCKVYEDREVGLVEVSRSLVLW